MKSKLFLIALAACITWTACNDSTTETSTTDSAANTTDMSASDNTTDGANTSINSSFDENESYVDLKTNKPVKLKKTEGSPYLYDFETNQPYSYFFYNPATRDTFDRSGNIVNNYLIRGTDGSYSLDESRWRTKVDEDGDVKMKDGDETKIKYDASSGKTKLKTADTTIKE